jgi:indolepyruvate decarboxylase
MKTPINRREFLGASLMAGVVPGLRGCFRGGGDASAVSAGEADHKDANPTVAEYVVQRLAALGIMHVFGVPGDYAFPIDLAIEKHGGLTWVGCSNELNAAYSADGYARINGAAILCTTYNVGSAAALAGIMGCKAERVPVFHLVGSPSTRLEKARRHMHHSYGDGNLEQFCSYHKVSVCATAYLTPENAIEKTECVIVEAATRRMPVYIEIPEDYALMPVIGTPRQGLPFAQVPTFTSDKDELAAALGKIRQRIRDANYTIILISFTIERYGLKKEVEDLLKATQIHFATTGMSKGLFSKSHPLFIGMYNGDFSPDVTAIMDKADLVLDLGGVVFCDGETGEFSDHLDPAKIITVWPDHVEFGRSDPLQATQGRVHMKDVIEGLTQNPLQSKPITGVEKLRFDWDKLADLIKKSIFHDLAGLLKSGDILVTDTGVGDLIATAIPLPEGVQFQHALLWGSIGWGTAAAFGVALAADPKKNRVVLIQGDGGHQCTANQIGVMGKYGVHPIIIILNNDIYGIEEVVMGNDNPRRIQQFDRIAQWDYLKIPDAMGCSNWRTHLVDFTDPWHLDKAVQSFKDAMEDARDRQDTGAYIVVKLNRDLLFPALPAPIRERLYQTPPFKARRWLK